MKYKANDGSGMSRYRAKFVGLMAGAILFALVVPELTKLIRWFAIPGPVNALLTAICAVAFAKSVLVLLESDDDPEDS